MHEGLKAVEKPSYLLFVVVSSGAIDVPVPRLHENNHTLIVRHSKKTPTQARLEKGGEGKKTEAKEIGGGGGRGEETLWWGP